MNTLTARVEGYIEVIRPIAETHVLVADFLGETTSALMTKYLENGPGQLQDLTLDQMCTEIPAPARGVFGVLESRPGEKNVPIHWNVPAELYEWYDEWSKEAGAAVVSGSMYSAFIAGLMDDVNRNHLVLDVVPYTVAERRIDTDLAIHMMGGGQACLDRDPNW